MKSNFEEIKSEFYKIPNICRAPDSYLDKYIGKEAIYLNKEFRKEIKIFDSLIELKLDFSNNELRRLIQQGGIKIDGEKISDVNQSIDILAEDYLILSIGKKRKYLIYMFNPAHNYQFIKELYSDLQLNLKWQRGSSPQTVWHFE